MIPKISEIPQNWTLTPLKGKRPYRKRWQTEPPVSKEIIESELKNKATGVGLRLGDISDGLLAIDFDGESANQIWNQLRSNHPEPTTCEWTSGKPGRKQMLLQIAPEHRELLKDFNRAQIPAAQGEQLEFRYNGSQSVLPPSIHPETQKPYIWLRPPSSGIAIAPEWLITKINQLIEIGGKDYMSYTQFCESITLPVDQAIPLEELIRKTEKDLLRTGVPDGSRNTEGIALAKNVFALEAYLTSIRQEYNGTAEELVRQYASRCNPPLSEKEIIGLIKQGLNTGSPTLSEDAIANCIKAYLWRMRSRGSERNYSQNQKRKVVPLPNTKGEKLLTPEETKKELEKLAKETKSQSQKRVKLSEIFARSQMTEIAIKETFKLIEEETEREGSTEEIKEELKNIETLQDCAAEINLADYINPLLAAPLARIKPIMGATELAFLTCLFPTAGSVCCPDLKLMLIEQSNFFVRGNNIYAGLCGESGSGKSPIMKMFTDPLGSLQAEENERHQAKKEEYEEELAAWEALPKGERGEKPKEPAKPREYLLSDITTESLSQTSNEQSQGYLLYYDELSSLITQQNRYKKGGNDEEVMLSGRDGTGIRVKRKGGTRYNKATASWTVLGGITTSILSKQMGTGLDEAGHWARFIMATLPNVEQEFPEDFPAVDISAMIKSLYQSIEKTTTDFYKEGGTNGLIRLSKRAKERYRKYWKETESAKIAEARPALRSVLAKSKRLVGEIALLLYVVEKAFSGEEISTKLPENFMELAIALTKVYVAQIRLIHFSQNKDDQLSPKLSKILELASRKGTINASDVKRSGHEFRKTKTSDIRLMFEDLASLGYGVLSGTTTKRTFTHKKKLSKSCQRNIDNNNTSNLYIESDADYPTHKKSCQDFPTGSNLDTAMDTVAFPPKKVVKKLSGSNNDISTTEGDFTQKSCQDFSHPDTFQKDNSTDDPPKPINTDTPKKVDNFLDEKQGQTQTEKGIDHDNFLTTFSEAKQGQPQTESDIPAREKLDNFSDNFSDNKNDRTQTETEIQATKKSCQQKHTLTTFSDEKTKTKIISIKEQFLGMVKDLRTALADPEYAMRAFLERVEKELSVAEMGALQSEILKAIPAEDKKAFINSVEDF